MKVACTVLLGVGGSNVTFDPTKRKGLAIDISPLEVIASFPNWLLADIADIPLPEPIQPQPSIQFVPKPKSEKKVIQLSLPLFG